MPSRQIYRTHLGKEIDMDSLRSTNETAVAVSNVKVNARGDELGPNGQIIKKREELANDYYATNPKSKSNQQG